MPLPANLVEPVNAAGTARAPRRVLQLSVQGTRSSGAAANVTVHNISRSGLLFESSEALQVDERIDMELPEAGATAMRIVWASGGFFGCQFEQPLSSGALSAAQLRSIVNPGGGTDQAVPSVPHEPFHLRLQRLRKQSRFSLAQLAERLGVSKPTVWAWEQGRSRPIEARIEELARILGVTPADLLPAENNAELALALERSKQIVASALGVSADMVRIIVEF